jgi:nifR3 family TIM-barrel protein
MKIGSIQLDLPFSQAGLAGYSDRAMRLVARRRGCPYAVTEAMLDTVMLNGGQGLRRAIDINDQDHPVAGQIIGSEPNEMARAAVIMYRAGFDVIDLNFACPVKKIRSKARGGHMLADVGRAVDILKAVRDALPPEAPTTVKLRRGFDDGPEALEAFGRIWEAVWANGYCAATVHGRTVEQKYQGPSRWEFLRRLKADNPARTIIGSGDVFCAADVVRMLEETRVDGVSIARGAIGNPWIFSQARRLLAAHAAGEYLELDPPTIYEQREALSEHFSEAMRIHGEQLAGRRMRKMGIKYSRFHPLSPEVKMAFIEVVSLRQWSMVLDRWYGEDGPGVWPADSAADEVNCEE